MRHAWSTYRRLIGAQVRSQLQYRVSFALDVLSTMMFTATEFGAFALVLNRFGSVGGWSLGEVAFLYGLVEISFASMDMLFGGFDAPSFGQQIRKGTLDQLLLRPVSLTLQVFGSDFALRRLGRVASGVVVFGFALALSPIDWTLFKVLYLPLVALGMILFFGGVFVIGGTLTFWTVEGTEAVNVLTYGGSNLIVYPMSIYEEWLRRLFTFVIPAAFLNYYPALYFLDKPDPFGLPEFASFVAPLAGGLVFLAALLFWRFGLKHYQSTGT
ncbi:ABC transporter permease [Deinococcus yavapaiensis]|uniref:ABC-2 type transport system permease protein n=1 Tax=Deinococcus yavapaiensis KR-236 TaxID=694435 RepID=A0A318SAW8_9DEIO|nr:ABC-2 family transporter protein [Deinococcus yavapaiensis]PYE55712.1 ABC-2 type transport system permease protein [Deinococcus yavapaiensis KR-236]